jgi:hypothetical protein
MRYLIEVAERPRFVSTVDEESGFRFVFKTDPADPDMLHIYARHLTTVEDAIETFFAGDPCGTRSGADTRRRDVQT